MEFPKDLKYSKNDEWVRVEGRQGTAGITDYAQDQLSDIVFVEFVVAPGETVAQGAVCANIESVKAAAEVLLPVGGKITAINDSLPNTPDQVNKEPYQGAWMLRFEIVNPKELDGLMDADAYEAYCKERSH